MTVSELRSSITDGVLTCSAADWIEHGDNLAKDGNVKEVRLTTIPQIKIMHRPVRIALVSESNHAICRDISARNYMSIRHKMAEREIGSRHGFSPILLALYSLTEEWPSILFTPELDYGPLDEIPEPFYEFDKK